MSVNISLGIVSLYTIDDNQAYPLVGSTMISGGVPYLIKPDDILKTRSATLGYPYSGSPAFGSFCGIPEKIYHDGVCYGTLLDSTSQTSIPYEQMIVGSKATIKNDVYYAPQPNGASLWCFGNMIGVKVHPQAGGAAVLPKINIYNGGHVSLFTLGTRSYLYFNTGSSGDNVTIVNAVDNNPLWVSTVYVRLGATVDYLNLGKWHALIVDTGGTVTNLSYDQTNTIVANGTVTDTNGDPVPSKP